MPEVDEDYRPMQVAQILDKTTLVITGEGLSELSIGDELQVVAVGREITNLHVPLAVPKATVSVTSIAGPYAIARTSTYQVEVDPLGIIRLGARKETRRYELAVNEKDLLGNPASTPVAVGDPVIQAGQLSRFVSHLQSKKA